MGFILFDQNSKVITKYSIRRVKGWQVLVGFGAGPEGLYGAPPQGSIWGRPQGSIWGAAQDPLKVLPYRQIIFSCPSGEDS